MSEEDLKNIQTLLEFTDEEMAQFKANPKNLEILKNTPNLINKTIVVEVTKSHGCASQHKVGDKFYFTGDGNLLTRLGPKRMCMSALSAAGGLVGSAVTFMWAGRDANDMPFTTAGCSDVGLQCGGWGNIVMNVRVEDRK
jgi:uncharacterized repeat protein (TIGR04076 family)